MRKIFYQIVSSLIIGAILFSIGFLSTTQNIPKAKAYEIKTTHPRLLLTPERLTRLRDLKNRNTVEWQNLLYQANLPVTDYNWQYNGQAAALVYQITGNVTYANKAKEIMNKQKTITSLVGDYYRQSAHTLALEYDWIYDQLSETEKQDYYAAMNRWADSEKPSLGTPGACLRGTDTDQQAADTRGMIFAGLSSYPENPRYQELITTAEDSCRGGQTKKWYSKTKGGLWPEGSSYSRGLAMEFGFIAPAYATAMGRDYWAEIGDPDMPKNMLLSYLYLLSPGGGLTPFSDISGGSNLNEYDPLFVSLADALDGTNEGQYAQYVLNHILTSRTNYQYWFFFLNYVPSPDRPERDYKLDLPGTFYAPDMGFMFSRSNWTNISSYISFQGHWKGGYVDHRHRDAGSFQIKRNSVWLTKELTNYWDDGPTAMHNTYLINQENDLATCLKRSGDQLSSGHSSINRFEGNNNYTFMEADITNSYWGGPGYCESWSTGDLYYSTKPGDINQNYYVVYTPTTALIRTMIHLEPDYYIVFDKVSTPRAQFSKKMMLRMLADPTIVNNQFSELVGNQKLFGKILSPENPNITKVDESVAYASYTGNLESMVPVSERKWQLRIQPPTEQKDDYFLTVLEGADATKADMVSSTKIDSTEGSSMGVQIGDRVVMFGKTRAGLAKPIQIDGNVTYSLAGSGTSKQLLTGLRASFPYDIYLNDNKIQTANSSDKGTLSFDVTLGASNNISVRPQNVPSVSITKSANRTSAKSGDTIIYTLNYANNGTVGAANAKVEDPIPVGTTFVSAENGGTLVNNKATWTIGNLAAGANGTVKFTVKIN